MAIRIKARSGESVELMLRRFKKLCEKEGLTKEVKRRAHYEKPSEIKRREKRRFETRPARPGADRRGGAAATARPKSRSSSGGM